MLESLNPNYSTMVGQREAIFDEVAGVISTNE